MKIALGEHVIPNRDALEKIRRYETAIERNLGPAHFLHFCLIYLNEAAQEVQAFLQTCFRIGLEGTFSCGHGSVKIGDTSERDGRDGFFVGRVDDCEVVAFSWVAPLPINIEFSAVLGSCSVWGRAALNDWTPTPPGSLPVGFPSGRVRQKQSPHRS